MPRLGERHAHPGEIDGVDANRALPEIEVDDRVDRFRHHAGARQQMRDRPIAMARRRFRAIDGIIDIELASRGAREAIEDKIESVGTFGVVQDAGDGNGAAIDHRVERAARMRIELDRVERIATRLDTDTLQHCLASDELDRETIGECLRNRLNGERRCRIADGVEFAVCRRDRETKRSGSALANSGM
jgi:hypothetical protein